MPNKFKINRPIADELLTHIQAHPKVTSAVRTNADEANEFTTVNLDANYTVKQIRETAIAYIMTKQDEIQENAIASLRKQEYEV